MAFDKLLKEAGEFGFFQKFYVCVFYHTAILYLVMVYWNQIFILVVPPHRCKTFPEDNSWYASSNYSNMTSSNYSNMTSNNYSNMKSSNYSNMTSSNCFLNVSGIGDNFKTSNNPHCPYGWVYDYSETHYTFSSQYDWVCENAWKIYSCLGAISAGRLIGSVFLGGLCDRFGRKRAFVIFVCIQVIGETATLFSNSFPIMFCTRLFVGVGLENYENCSMMLAMEYMGPQYRTVILAIYTFTFTLFSAITPFIAFHLAYWHYSLVFGSGLAAISLITISFIPESASWLISMGRHDEAVRCIQQIAKINSKSLTQLRIKQLLTEEESNTNSEICLQENDEVTSHSKVNNPSFVKVVVEMSRSPRMRKNTILMIIIGMISFVCYLGSCYETENLPLPFTLSYTIGALAEVPGSIINILVLDRIGRRWANAMFYTVGGVCGIIAGNATNNIVVLTLAFIMRMCNAVNYDIKLIQCTEIFPTIVRGRCMAILKFFSVLASILSPFIVSLSQMDKLLPLVVFGVLGVLGGILALFLPETAGEHLPQTVEEGENFGKGQSFFYVPFLHRKTSGPNQADQPLAQENNENNLKCLDGTTEKL